MYVCVCVCVCVCLSVSVCLSVCLCVCVFCVANRFVSSKMRYQLHFTDRLWFNQDGFMMTSSNIFRVTGSLCGEFTGPGEFPTQNPVTRSFDVFFDLRLNKRLSKQPWGWWFETPSWSLWRQCNVCACCWWKKGRNVICQVSVPVIDSRITFGTWMTSFVMAGKISLYIAVLQGKIDPLVT